MKQGPEHNERTRQRVRRALIERGLDYDRLAEAVGLKRRSLLNVLNGSVGSASARQRITNFLQVKIWPEINVTERVVSLPVGTLIMLQSEDAAINFRREAGVIGYGMMSTLVAELQSDSKLLLCLTAISKTPTGRTPSP